MANTINQAHMQRFNWRVPLAFFFAPALPTALLVLIEASVTGQWYGIILSLITTFLISVFFCVVLGGPIYLVLKRFRAIGIGECIIAGMLAGMIFGLPQLIAGVFVNTAGYVNLGGGTGCLFWAIVFWRLQGNRDLIVSIKLLLISRIFVVAGTIAILAILPIFWLSQRLDDSKIEDSMYKRLDARLDKKISRIDCYAEAIGRSFRPELVCGYSGDDKTKWNSKYIDLQNDVHPPSWAFQPNTLDFVFYERQSSRKLFFQIHSNSIESRQLTRSNKYWMDAVGDAIAEGQPH